VEGNRWQRDWKVSEVAARVLALPPADAHAVDAVLNCWAGRFARRNFPLLIRVKPHFLPFFCTPTCYTCYVFGEMTIGADTTISQ
jgi:hypothetical protein